MDLRASVMVVVVVLVGACRPDGGADAGTADAGTADAGTRDGGHGLVLAACGLQAPSSAEPFALLDLGHAAGISCLQRSEQSVLSIDSSGRWLLWRSADGARLASGAAEHRDQPSRCEDFGAFLRGGTLAFAAPGQSLVQLLSATSGAPLGSVNVAPNWGLSSDGNALWSASSTALEVFSSTGVSLFTQAGDYAGSRVFAGPNELRVARDTLGLQRFALPSGTSSVLSAYSGNFLVWFDDGAHFFTSLATTVWVYSPEGIQQAILNVPKLALGGTRLAGHGDWYWVMADDRQINGIPFFRLDAGTSPVETRLIPFGQFIPAGEFIGIPRYGEPTLEMLHLEAAAITSATFSLRTPYLSSFGATARGEWVVGAENGSVWNQPAGGGEALPLGCGKPTSVAVAESGLAAVSTGSGQILLVDLRSDGGHQLRPSIDFYSTHVELSADGRTLVTSGSTVDAQYWDDRSLRIYDPADGGLERRWGYAWSDYPTLFFGFSLAREGTRLDHLVGTWNGQSWSMSNVLTERDGGVLGVIAAPAGSGFPDSVSPMWLAPDGVHSAMADTVMPRVASTTQLFTDGILSGATLGKPVGWLSNDHLLLNFYRVEGRSYVFDRAEVHDTQGALVTRTTLPELSGVTPLSGTTIYDPTANATFDLNSGQRLWTNFYGVQPNEQAAAAGGFAIYTRGPMVHAEPY